MNEETDYDFVRYSEENSAKETLIQTIDEKS